ncbi:hypothetical protein ACPXAO_24260, partial [Salmonella enterica]|uniref:hypothetical protein n=1 Tax=Salmonella enterica TaxID=28901 RepID=UPI003CF54404
EEGFGLGDEQLRLTLVGALPGLPAGRSLGIGVSCQATDTGLVSTEDARGEHGLRSGLAHVLAGSVDKPL